MILSSKNIVIVHLTFLNAIVYKLLTDAPALAKHPLIFIVGRAMRLPDIDLYYDDPKVGIIVVVMLNMIITDLATMMTDSSSFLGVAVPFRLMLCFTVAAFAYLTSESNVILSNSAVFCFSFIEIVIQFWLFLTLREERQRLIKVPTVPE
ncbi:increased loss of mitochondrial DNA protein 1 [Dipodascopsis uninucleata]